MRAALFGRTELKRVHCLARDAIRLFMVPGMGHCGGGPGVNTFDAIGARHIRTPPYTPRWNGKIERFHKTLRTELLTGHRFNSLAHAQQVLDDWVDDDIAVPRAS